MGRFGRLLAAVALVGAGVLGFGSPALADAPTVEFTNNCGAVGVRIINAAGQQITYSRNGVVFAKFTESLDDGNGLAGVNAGGDVLTVTVGATPFVHTYAVPDGCTQPAALTFGLETICQELSQLRIHNAGSTPIAGFFLKLDTGAPEAMDPIAPGDSTAPVFDAENIQVSGPLGASSVAVLWLLLPAPHGKVDGCGPDTLTAAFEDTCDGVKVTVTSSIRTAQGYLIVKNPDTSEGDVVEVGFVVSPTPDVHQVPAAAGDEIAVYYPLVEETPVPEAWSRNPKAGEFPGAALIGAHVHVKPVCGGGGLPTTGFKIGLAAGLGGLLIVGGALLFVLTRRRRTA